MRRALAIFALLGLTVALALPLIWARIPAGLHLHVLTIEVPGLRLALATGVARSGLVTQTHARHDWFVRYDPGTGSARPPRLLDQFFILFAFDEALFSDHAHRALGFEYRSSLHQRAVTLPTWYLWFPLIVTLLLLLRILRPRPQLPVTSSLCPKCSYDLRAHSPGQKCPECGTPIVKAASLGPGRGCGG